MHAISGSTFCRDSLWCCYEALSLAFISTIISPVTSHHKLQFFYFPHPCITKQVHNCSTAPAQPMCKSSWAMHSHSIWTFDCFQPGEFPESVFRTLQDCLIQIFAQLPLIPLKLSTTSSCKGSNTAVAVLMGSPRATVHSLGFRSLLLPISQADGWKRISWFPG